MSAAADPALAMLCRAFARKRDQYNWGRAARPDQLPPGEPGAADSRVDWRYWVIQAGRGWGKTKTGAETVRRQVLQGRRRSIALVAPTLGDGRKLMIEGPSGILACSPKAERPRWIDRDRELHWPNGAIGYLYTSEEPERARGGNHDFLWGDEMGSWAYPEMMWKLIRLALRITGPRGDRPQAVITMTPRPTSIVRALLANPATVVTRGSTYDNRANLDPDFFEAIREEYEGTRLGDQEIKGELLKDTPGALWRLQQIEDNRVAQAPVDLIRKLLGIDPAVADPEGRRAARESEIYIGETGMVLAARARCTCRNKEEQHGFVLQDLSGYYPPEEWGRIAVNAVTSSLADGIVAEVNQGGALVAANIRAQGGGRIPIKEVHASRGKQTRAEPISSMSEQGKIHHVGVLPKLEDQLCTWNPLVARKSPDRLDAYVWVLTELMMGARPATFAGLAQPNAPRRI